MAISSDIFVASSCPRMIVRFLEARNAPVSEIESILGDTIEALDSADFRVPITRHFDLWNYAIEFSKQSNLGLHLGTQYDDESVGLLGHIFFSNATIREALAQYQRYFLIGNEAMQVNLGVIGDYAHLEFICLEDELYCIPEIERITAAGITRSRAHLKHPLPLNYVSFQHPPPDYAGEYQSVFECPIKFSSKKTEVVFNKKYLDYRLPHKSSYLQKVLSSHLDTLLSKIKGKDKFEARVSKLITKRLANDSIEAEQIAKKLNMSRNTMYRRLTSEGISFHELVDKIRKEKAISYMEQGQYSLSQIAFLLGFSELSAFSRAFKRWTGFSPGKYLKQQNG